MKSRTRKKREHPKGGSQPEEMYGLATRKNMFLDRPTAHGGWPEGEYDPPVNDRIYNYLRSMGMIQEHTRRYLTQIIREELQANLKESSSPMHYYPPGDPRRASTSPAAPLKAIDPLLVTSEQRYRELTDMLKQLVGKLIVTRRSSGSIQETSFLAYDPLNKYIFLTWDESGSIAVKPSPLDSDFININGPKSRAILTQLQELTFPTFDVKASEGGTHPNAFVSYVEPEGVRFTFPVGTDYLIFGNFRGEIALCTVPSAQNEGSLMRKCARTNYVAASDM